MALKLYLAARPAGGSQNYGHLFLILWDDVNDIGLTIGGNQTGSLGLGPLLSYVNLENTLPVGTGPGENPDRFTTDEFDITLNRVELTGVGDPQAVWNQMATYAQGINGLYDYDLSAGIADANGPIANSNAFIYSILNAVGIDPRAPVNTISGVYGNEVPGANPHNSTLLCSATPINGAPMELIAASENLSEVVLEPGPNGAQAIALR